MGFDPENLIFTPVLETPNTLPENQIFRVRPRCLECPLLREGLWKYFLAHSICRVT